jgi:hypothetical protein
MGGITGEKNAPGPVIGHLALVDDKPGEPDR